MDQSLLSFYARSSPGAAEVVAGAAVSETSPVPGTKVSVQRHATPCPYGTTIGCRRAFRSKDCCYAVQDHHCDPPSELLPSFVKGEGPVTMAQVYVASGCYR